MDQKAGYTYYHRCPSYLFWEIGLVELAFHYFLADLLTDSLTEIPIVG
jgi:hypothetical protein